MYVYIVYSLEHKINQQICFRVAPRCTTKRTKPSLKCARSIKVAGLQQV